MEAKEFREFCVEVSPKFDPPSHTTIAKGVYQLCLEEKKEATKEDFEL